MAGNIDIKFLVVSNGYQFYIFEASTFERAFFNNTSFKRDFIEWQEKKKSDHTTDFFYNNIAKPYIQASDYELLGTYFDLKDYTEALTNHDLSDDKKLIPLFKVFSPEHLLKGRQNTRFL